MKKTSVLAGSLAVTAVALFATPGLASANPEPAPVTNLLDGKTVFLDPGSSIATAVEQAQTVADGRGGVVPCVNPVAVAANGTSDQQVNFAVAKMVEAALQSQGAEVILSRADAAGFGGCVDQRAAAANASGADLALSINSVVQDAAQRGFLLETAAPGAIDPTVVGAQQAVSADATSLIRDASVAGGFLPAQYFGGQNGIAQTAAALPSLVNVPLVYANLGNLANPEDAALLTSAEGQVQYAAALTNGVIAQLTGQTIPGPAVSEDVASQEVTPPVAVAEPSTVPVAPVAGVQTPIVPAVPGQSAAVSPVAPVGSVPAATAPVGTAPAATAPVGTAPATTGVSPVVPGVPLLAGSPPPGGVQSPVAVPSVPGASAPVGTVPAPVAAAAPAPAPVVTIPGLGELTLPQLPTITLPGQAEPVGLSRIMEMGPAAAEFLSSPAGSQLIGAIISSPQAFNSLQAAQGPAAAQEILRAILGAGALLPR